MKGNFKTHHVTNGEYFISNTGLTNIKTQKMINITNASSNICQINIKNISDKSVQVSCLDLHIFHTSETHKKLGNNQEEVPYDEKSCNDTNPMHQKDEKIY